MFGKNVLFLGVVCFLFLGCAQPKYENGNGTGSEIGRQAQGQSLGLSFANAGMQMAWRWEKDPIGTEEGILLLRTYKASTLDGLPEPTDVTGALTMKLWMPDMGHGSSPTTVERLLDASGQIVPGSYRIKGIYFIMPGLWEMIFEIQEGGVIRDSAKITLTRAS